MHLVATDVNGRLVGSIEVTADLKTIGRGAQCHLQITGEGVSRTHASIYLHDRGVVVSDEGSANGVKVDGRLIEGPTLVDGGNRISISSLSMRLQAAPEGSNGDASFDGGERFSAPVGEDTDEEFDTRLEIQSGAGAALARTQLTLVGRGGPYDGTVIVLDQVLSTVGRDEDNQVVLEDPSVSRRHAQLRLSALGDRVTVVDLRSSNGTFVNGDKTKRADVGEGSILRFGDLGFKLQIQRDTPGAKKRETSKRGRLFLAAGGVVALLLILGVVAYVKRSVPVVKKVLTPEEILRKRQAEVQALVDEARRLVVQRRWSRAIVRVDEALKKDPLNAEAQRYRKNALDELTNQKIFEEAGKFFALGNRENLQHALKIFRKVPKKSIYSRDTRYKIRTIRQRMAEGYRIEGMSRCKAHYRKRCYELLCKFFHEMPSSVQVAGEPGLRRRMVAIERRYRRQKSFTKCDAPRYLRTPGKAGSASLDQLLAEKYQDIRLRKVVAVYVGGKIDMALKIAAKYKTKRYMRPHLRQLAEITGRMLTIRGKYQEGYSFLRQRKVKEADENFGVLLDADAALVPKKIESFYRKEVKTDLSALYVVLGREDFKVKHYRDAFRFWKRGSEIDKTNAAILNGLLRLEKVAEILLREGRAASDQGHIPQARKKLTEARDIVRAGQAIRKQTDKALAALGK